MPRYPHANDAAMARYGFASAPADSTEDLSYFDEPTKERFYPYVIEPAAGVNRTVLAVLMDAYSEKTNDKGETRVILKLHPALAPIKAAVLPLAKNKPEIVGTGEGDQAFAAAGIASRL